MSAICQRLSSPSRWIRSTGNPMSSRQIRSASSSSSCTVTHSRPASNREHLGVELPREADRVGFEVVAEAEVAEHLEEREVTVGAADVVEVVVLATGPYALLHRDGTRERRRLVAGEVALERDHARHGEQQRGIDRDHAGRRDRDVAARLEELREGAPQLVGALRTIGHRIQATARPRARLSFSSASRSRMAARPSSTAARMVPPQRSATSGGA